jgi:AmmeMemoRadiSam system protein B/AmmeMemoRadiSam system protein A
MVDGFLSQAKVPEIKDVVAVISPHAGYVYSGQVAAYSYALLKGRKIDRVVVISPSHYEAFTYASVYDGTAYATPLGEIPVDQDFAKKLAGMSSHIKLSSSGHSISREQGEHSLEVQLPFLQRVLGQFKLAPIVMGDQSYDTCRALGVALAKLIHEPGTLIVASSDLSHFHTYDEAVKLDHKTLKAIEEWDYLSMSRNFERMVWEACGGGPIVATMIAAERLGANQAKVLKYANTGDVTGDRSRVVGYGAVALVKAPSANVSHDGGFALSEQEKNQLLYIARKSVETAVTERKLFECSAAGYEGLAQERGAFVTLKKKGELRGCIGYVAPVKPLCLTVRDVAAMAALNDQRFPPVSTKELSQLEYEISVLSPLRRVLDVKQIVVGRDGLVIKKGPSEGLLLPQVPVEQHWDRTEFLEQTCVKAGLPPRAWRDEDSDIFSFTALVFGEYQPVLEKTKALLKAPEPGLLLPSAAQF